MFYRGILLIECRGCMCTGRVHSNPNFIPCCIQQSYDVRLNNIFKEQGGNNKNRFIEIQFLISMRFLFITISLPRCFFSIHSRYLQIISIEVYYSVGLGCTIYTRRDVCASSRIAVLLFS